MVGFLMTSSDWTVYQFHLLSEQLILFPEALACSRSFGSLSINWKIMILFPFISRYYLETPILLHLFLGFLILFTFHILLVYLLDLVRLVVLVLPNLPGCISLSPSSFVLRCFIYDLNFLAFDVSVGNTDIGYFIYFEELVFIIFLIR